MKSSVFASVLLLLPLTLLAQLPQADQIETDNGTLTVQPIVHGTLALEWNDRMIYVDPYGGAEAFEGLDSPDLILITDIHGDHLHPETLEALDTEGALLVVPQAVADQLGEEWQDQLVILDNGSSTEQLDIPIRAIPMYNLPEDEESRHTKGRGNGYVVTLGGKDVYLSGDTEDIPEMRALEGIDIAFVCMNLPYTMDVNQAADAVLDFKPGIVYPYHYRGQNTEQFRELVNAGSDEIEVRLRDWY